MITQLTVRLQAGPLREFKEWECDIEMSLEQSLAELHLAIQAAVDFGNDHLYEFSVGRQPYDRGGLRFDCEEGIDRIPLAKLLEQAKGSKIFYLFDFGDEWVFRLLPSRKRPWTAPAGIRYPRVIAQRGDKPQQYPDWDE